MVAARPKEPTFHPNIVHAHSYTDMDPSREDSGKRRRKEEERMGEAYKQLKRDLRHENWEQWKRRRDEEKKMKKEERTWEETEKWKKEVVEPAYEKLQAEVKKYDDGMVLGWKEDIDTLLVFVCAISFD